VCRATDGARKRLRLLAIGPVHLEHRESLGRTSFSSSRPLAYVSVNARDVPVILPLSQARLAAWPLVTWSACTADTIGIGPIYAIPKLLKQYGLKVSDIGLWRLNEAFACQVAAVLDEPMRRDDPSPRPVSSK
jgi:acetyl-CoA acetyltransferase